MEKITYKNNNKLIEIDRDIKFAFETVGTEHAIIIFPTIEQQKLYILNIKTIICMAKEYNLHYHIIDEELDTIYEIIKNINCKDISSACMIIAQNIIVINRILKNYYFPRNYIYPRYYNELLISETGKKILLENPFFINNHMEYFCFNRITKEEQIINTIIEYYFSAKKETKHENETLIATKKVMQKNLKPKELENYILFIISNTYQEVMENNADIEYIQIKHIVENKNNSKYDLIKCFLENDYFSNVLLARFIKYNMNIEKTRLNDLKTKPSFQYSKRLY